MREYNLTIVPVGHGSFSASLGDDVVLERTSEPLLDGARALLKRGAHPGAVVTTRHAGSPHIAMRSTVGEAARWTVQESATVGPSFRKWKPFTWKPNSATSDEGGADLSSKHSDVQGT
jgi:hypothetical protein